MSRKLLSGVSLSLALSASVAHAQVAPIDGGTFITNSDMVEIYTLPANLQSVVEGDDDKYYAINYYTYVNPQTSKLDDAIPGISVGTWWDNADVNMFFPWGEDEKLAERLSIGYKKFAEDNDLLGGTCEVDNGTGDPLDLCLNGCFWGDYF